MIKNFDQRALLALINIYIFARKRKKKEEKEKEKCHRIGSYSSDATSDQLNRPNILLFVAEMPIVSPNMED